MANQRKKSDRQSDATVPAGGGSGTEEKISLNEQLDRAEAAVQKNRQTSLQLHQQWRTHLLRMSYLVIIVKLHQAQAPTEACIKEIKHWNEIRRHSMQEEITGFGALMAILNDSHVELLGIACAGCLLWCLSLPMVNRDFSTIPYRLSCSFIPMIVSLYFSNKTMGCIKDEMAEHTIEDLPERSARGFPLVLVFHTIVSISLWFMQYQVGQHQKNIDMVEKLRKDLKEAREAKKGR